MMKLRGLVLGVLLVAPLTAQAASCRDQWSSVNDMLVNSGALETVPWVRVVNLARALDELAEVGYWRIGLAGEAEATLAESLSTGPLAIVLGAEGEGMRHNIAGHCDTTAKLPISSDIESLNVSNAAAIALYAVATRSSG